MREQEMATLFIDFNHVTLHNEQLAEQILAEFFRCDCLPASHRTRPSAGFDGRFEPYLCEGLREFVVSKHPEMERDDHDQLRRYHAAFHSLPVTNRQVARGEPARCKEEGDVRIHPRRFQHSRPQNGRNWSAGGHKGYAGRGPAAQPRPQRGHTHSWHALGWGLGTVVRTSAVHPELVVGTFTCLDCQSKVPNIEQQFQYTEVMGEPSLPARRCLLPQLHPTETVLS
jgi:hypothetical protein